jgi:hypothetical protein
MYIDRTHLSEGLIAMANAAAQGSRLVADFATRPHGLVARTRTRLVRTATATVGEPMRTLIEVDVLIDVASDANGFAVLAALIRPGEQL